MSNKISQFRKNSIKIILKRCENIFMLIFVITSQPEERFAVLQIFLWLMDDDEKKIVIKLIKYFPSSFVMPQNHINCNFKVRNLKKKINKKLWRLFKINLKRFQWHIFVIPQIK